MISVVKLFWIIQLFVVICAQGQPRHGGAKQRFPYMRSVNSEKDLVKDANAYLHSKPKIMGKLKRSQEWNTASNMGLSAADQNGPNTCQMVQNSAVGPRSSLPITYSHQAPLYQQLEQPMDQQVNSPAGVMCDPLPNAYVEADETEQRRQDLRNLVQHLYVAQARVQLEATEIKKAQAVASSAQSQLEDSANQVRSVTASLHTAQQEVAASAIRAQIAQLQLAAHDQLLFAARQDVDALSSQMVGLQAAEGIVQPKLTVDLHALLDKLKQPLQQNDHPTPVPAIVHSIPGMPSHQQQQPLQQQLPQPQPQQWQPQSQGQAPAQPPYAASKLMPREKRFSQWENF